jgi:hypothetical protein
MIYGGCDSPQSIAYDTASGDLLWEYAHTFERSRDVSLPRRLRAVATAADKVLLATRTHISSGSTLEAERCSGITLGHDRCVHWQCVLPDRH